MGVALERFIAHFDNPVRDGKGYRVRCPAHDDQDPSLHIEENVDGTRVLVHCRAGCDTERAVTLAGATMRELYESYWSQNGAPAHTQKPAQPKFGKIVKAYDYVTSENVLLYQAVRDEHKNFRLRRPSNNDPGVSDQFIYDIEGVSRVLYRLPEVQAARHLGTRIYVVEGEKDADTLASLGLTATTAAGGASAPWLPQYTDRLVGAAEVVIIPDNDEPGRKHAEKVRNAIAEHVLCVKTLILPNLLDKGDVSDWISAGGTKAELEQLATDAPPFIAPAQRFTSIALTLDDFLTHTYNKPRSLWGNGVISAGDLVFLYGRPGLGKTWLTLQILLALAQGNGPLGLAAPEGGPIRVGILELELSGYWFQKRLNKLIGDATRDFGEQISIVARPDLRGAVDMIKDDWKALEKWCRDDELDLLCIDALSRTHTTDESKAIEFGPVLQCLDDIRFETGTAITCIHHEPKTSADGKERDDMDALRGSSRMASDANTLIRLCKAGHGGALYNLRFPKVNNAEEPATIWMARGKAGFEIVEAPELIREGNVERVRATLLEAGAKGLSTEELASKVGLKESSLRGEKGHLKAVGAEQSGEEYSVKDDKGRVRRYKRWKLSETRVESSVATSIKTQADIGLE